MRFSGRPSSRWRLPGSGGIRSRLLKPGRYEVIHPVAIVDTSLRRSFFPCRGTTFLNHLTRVPVWQLDGDHAVRLPGQPVVIEGESGNAHFGRFWAAGV